MGSVVGPAARTRRQVVLFIFFARLGEKTASEDLVLLDLDLSESRRNIDLGGKPGKPVFPVNPCANSNPKKLHKVCSG